MYTNFLDSNFKRLENKMYNFIAKMAEFPKQISAVISTKMSIHILKLSDPHIKIIFLKNVLTVVGEKLFSLYAKKFKLGLSAIHTLLLFGILVTSSLVSHQDDLCSSASIFGVCALVMQQQPKRGMDDEVSFLQMKIRTQEQKDAQQDQRALQEKAETLRKKEQIAKTEKTKQDRAKKEKEGQKTRADESEYRKRVRAVKNEEVKTVADGKSKVWKQVILNIQAGTKATQDGNKIKNEEATKKRLVNHLVEQNGIFVKRLKSGTPSDYRKEGLRKINKDLGVTFQKLWRFENQLDTDDWAKIKKIVDAYDKDTQTTMSNHLGDITLWYVDEKVLAKLKQLEKNPPAKISEHKYVPENTEEKNQSPKKKTIQELFKRPKNAIIPSQKISLPQPAAIVKTEEEIKTKILEACVEEECIDDIKEDEEDTKDNETIGVLVPETNSQQHLKPPNSKTSSLQAIATNPITSENIPQRPGPPSHTLSAIEEEKISQTQ